MVFGEKSAMLAKFLRTKIGSSFVEFLRTKKGKAVDKFLVKYFGFSLLMYVFALRAGFPPIAVLLLHTIGRKSGRENSVVMPYLEINHRLYLIGANGAKPTLASWVQNILVNPRVRVVLHGTTRRLRARLVEPGSPEREQVWQFAATKTPQYNIYQARMNFPAPVVALEDAGNA